LFLSEKRTYKELENYVLELEKEIFLQKRYKDISNILFKISNAVTITNDLDELYQLIHKALSPVIDTTNFFIATYDKSKDSLFFPYCIDSLDDFYPPVLAISTTESLTAEVIRKGQPLLITKEEMLKQRTATNRKIPECSPAEVWLGVPLQTKDGMIGVMAVQSYTDSKLYDQMDIDMMVSVADQVASAIERKRVENALRDSEEKYRGTFESITDSITVTRVTDGLYRYVNDGFCNQTGYSRREVLGRTPSDINLYAFPEERDRFIAALKKHGKTEDIVIHFRRKSGEIYHSEFSAKPILYEGEECLVAQSRDITKRRQAEESLMKSEQELKSIFRAAPTGIGLVCDRVIQKVNDRFCEMMGYSPDDLIGQGSRILYDSDEEFEFVGKEKYKQISKMPTGTVETKFKCKNGKLIDIILSSTPIDTEDLSKGVTFTAQDITYLKTKEYELSESEAKYRSMMEAMDDSVYICSSDYHIEYMNPTMIRRTGRDAIGELCYKVIHGRDDKCPWCVFKQVLKGKSVNHEIVSPKGNKTFNISNSPIYHADGSISKLSILRDTTDFKEMEGQLQQAQKMESIGTLAGGIAHDFNNILFPIFGYLEMALDDIPEGSPLRDQLATVLSGAQRARDLVQQILTFSRQSEHELKPLKIQIVIKEVLKLLRSSIPTTIEINQNINRDCGLVMADPSHIHQIIMNLCTNAFHAMEETGGKLSVTLEEIYLTVDDLQDKAMIPGFYNCLVVTDTGHGMEQHVIDRIFDPYFTTKAAGKGTGLGLSVIHGIVKDYGGHINIYSEPLKGSEFKIYLPVIQLEKAVVKSETDLPVQQGSERILLVDDQDVVAELGKKMLERLGYRVTVRTNSVDALGLFRAKPHDFDLVLTDMTMPNMTGDKLAGELIKIRSDIPIIMCTGFSDTMSEKKAATLGIKGFLLKPILKKDLSQKVREVLDD
jgi:PAS domain S-box-containing protein